MNARQCNGIISHKSWTKSILFLGLIGFNFLIISDGYGANHSLDNQDQELLNSTEQQEKIEYYQQGVHNRANNWNAQGVISFANKADIEKWYSY